MIVVMGLYVLMLKYGCNLTNMNRMHKIMKVGVGILLVGRRDCFGGTNGLIFFNKYGCYYHISHGKKNEKNWKVKGEVVLV